MCVYLLKAKIYSLKTEQPVPSVYFEVYKDGKPFLQNKTNQLH